jgi:hypothetical protein
VNDCHSDFDRSPFSRPTLRGLKQFAAEARLLLSRIDSEQAKIPDTGRLWLKPNAAQQNTLSLMPKQECRVRLRGQVLPEKILGDPSAFDVLFLDSPAGIFAVAAKGEVDEGDDGRHIGVCRNAQIWKCNKGMTAHS